MDELLTRGVERIYPSQEALEAKLAAGEKIKIYLGIDPTGPSLHLGHATTLLKLKEFQDAGHEIIILYGGFTAQIGDPTDKLAVRQPLSEAQVQANAAAYREQIGHFLDLGKTSFVDNNEWTSKLTPADLLHLASQFTVAQLLERDMFQERIKQGKEISAHEFLYPLFQAYDSVALEVDAEIGGNDQTFNMLAGRTLLRKLKNKEKFVVTMKLLIDPTGKKMGKTEGNMVTLMDAPGEMYGKVMSWPDSLLPLGFEICTRLPLEENLALAESDPKQAKMKLAREIVRQYHGEEAGAQAEQEFTRAFQGGQIPEELPRATAAAGERLVEVLLRAEAIASKTEFRRLIEAGAIDDLDVGEAITDPDYSVSKLLRLRIGKKRFLQIELN